MTTSGYVDWSDWDVREHGDIETVLDLLRSLSCGPVEADTLLRRRGMEAKFASPARFRGIHIGVGMVMRGLCELLDSPLDLIPPVIRKVRSLEAVREEHLPMLAGAMTAAALGMRPHVWRHEQGGVPRPESLAWLYAAWFLADYIDYAADSPGKALAELVPLLRRQAGFAG